MDRHRALGLLASSAGHGLDPSAVAAFQRMLGRFPVGSLVRLTSGEVAVVVRQHDHRADQPTVLVLFDRHDTPTDVEERDLAEAGPDGPVVVQRVDPDVLGVDLPRFVVSGQLHELPSSREAGGLVHEPAPGEQTPPDYVDTHAQPGHHHHPESRPDPDVAPPFE